MQVRMSNKAEATWHGLPDHEWAALVAKANRRMNATPDNDKDTDE
jgi:hypothetical protein